MFTKEIVVFLIISQEKPWITLVTREVWSGEGIYLPEPRLDPQLVRSVSNSSDWESVIARASNNILGSRDTLHLSHFIFVIYISLFAVSLLWLSITKWTTSVLIMWKDINTSESEPTSLLLVFDISTILG